VRELEKTGPPVEALSRDLSFDTLLETSGVLCSDLCVTETKTFCCCVVGVEGKAMRGTRGLARAGGLARTLPRGRTGSRSTGVVVSRRSNTYDEMFATTEADQGAYLALGVSVCYRKDEEGKLSEIQVIEPINATTLETMSIGAATSFKYVTGVTLGGVLDQDKVSMLPEEYQKAEFCEDFKNRAEICARTWDRPYPQESLMDIVPLGNAKTDWNFDISKHKRVLNLVHEVTDEDNIKQDKSIDVYGRFDDDDEEG